MIINIEQIEHEKQGGQYENEKKEKHNVAVW